MPRSRSIRTGRRRTRTRDGCCTSRPRTRRSDSDRSYAHRQREGRVRHRNCGRAGLCGHLLLPRHPLRVRAARLRALAGRSPELSRARAERPVVESGAHAARAGHGAIDPVDYRRPSRHDQEEIGARHGPAPRQRDRRLEDLPRHRHHRPRRDGHGPRSQARAEHGQQLRRPGASGLLRRPHVPPGRPRLRDPGRLPGGQRARRARLQVRRRAGAG